MERRAMVGGCASNKQCALRHTQYGQGRFMGNEVSELADSEMIGRQRRAKVGDECESAYLVPGSQNCQALETRLCRKHTSR